MLKKDFKIICLIIISVISSISYSQSNAQMKEISSKRFDKFDKELNQVYQRIMKERGGKQKDNIRQAQRDWLKFRDGHCLCESTEHEGGTLEGLVHIECLARLTEERVKQLKTFLYN
jgi:uncharacterized protein YecT (DUF1311 family)